MPPRDRPPAYPASIVLIAFAALVYAVIQLASYGKAPDTDDARRPAPGHSVALQRPQGPMDPAEPGSGPNGEPADLDPAP
jgi:hypothetical protein